MAMLENLQKKKEFQMLALDHFGSIVAKVGKENLVGFKKDILQTLGAKASAVLLDTEYGLPAYRGANIKTCFILKADPKGEANTPSLSPTEAKTQGAAAIKFWAKYPLEQKDLIATLAAEASQEGLPFILEITLVDTALEVTLIAMLTWHLPVSIFKLPYPGSPENCQKITKLLGKTPWVMLSGGDNFDTFLQNYQIAKANGCVGFLAGRSLWQEALDIPQKKREGFIIETVIPKWERLIS
ncbi:MAG: hypothetical protein ABH814_01820 [bacterium]